MFPKYDPQDFVPFNEYEFIVSPKFQGIHSTKYEEFLFITFKIYSSASCCSNFPRYNTSPVRYLPCLGSQCIKNFENKSIVI